MANTGAWGGAPSYVFKIVHVWKPERVLGAPSCCKRSVRFAHKCPRKKSDVNLQLENAMQQKNKQKPNNKTNKNKTVCWE
jgi:hypothetical protein